MILRRGRADLPPLRRCAQGDRDDHRRARRAQDPRATSSCPAQPRRSLPPERLPSPSSPGSPRRERAAHLQRGAVWRRRALGRKPSASVRLEAAPEALQNSMTSCAPPRRRGVATPCPGPQAQRIRPARRGCRGSAEQHDVRPKDPHPLVRGLETYGESARTATLCRGSSAWSSYPLIPSPAELGIEPIM